MDLANMVLLLEVIDRMGEQCKLASRLLRAELPEVEEDLETCALILERSLAALKSHVTPVGNAGKTASMIGSVAALPKEKPQ